MKKTIINIIFALSLVGCGSSGGHNTNTPEEKFEGPTIQNVIVENVHPYGFSSFAMGVVGKFPLEDNQTKDGVGYKSVAKVVRHIATNEMYIFPEKGSPEQIKETIASFINDGHNVTHEIHVLSGPGMRTCSCRWMNSVAGKNVCAKDFKNMIRWDPKVRNAVQKLFVEVVKYARELESVGANVIICPELEDNHDKDSFKALLDLLLTTGWEKSKIVRNGGSIGDFGLRYETHNNSLNAIGALRSGDIYNNDGNAYCLNSDKGTGACAPGSLSEDFLREIIKHNQKKGVITFIWTDITQGLIQTSPGNFIRPVNSSDRQYILRKPKEIAAILLGIPAAEVKTK